MVGDSGSVTGTAVSSGGAATGVTFDGRALILTALDGATGETLWTRRFDTGVLAGWVGQSAGERRQAVVAQGYSAFVDILGGGTTDSFLVTTVTRRDTPVGITSTNVATVVGGTDGTDVTAITHNSEGTRLVVRAAGDVTGDGLGDLAFLRTGGSKGIITFDGTTGQQVWSTPDVPDGASDPEIATASAVGDVNNDGVADVAHLVTYSQDATLKSHRAIVSGRTLNLLRARAGGSPLVAATGAGTGEFIDVIANIGLTRPTCTTVEVPNSGCALGSSSNSRVRTFVLSGTNGALHWQA